MKGNEKKFAKNLTTSTFANNEHFLPDHPFPKGICLIVGDSMLAGIDANRLNSGNYKVKVTFFADARTDGIYDYLKLLLRTALQHFAHWNK